MLLLILWIFHGITVQGSTFDRNQNAVSSHLHRHCLNSRLVCATYPGLTSYQAAFCRKHPALTFAAMLGVRWSLQECSHQFREERWNCSNLLTAALRDGFPFKHKFLKRGYRESAVALAFLSAGILTEISKSCISGELPFCETKELNNLIINNKTNYNYNYNSYNYDYNYSYNHNHNYDYNHAVINGTKIYSRSHNISLYYADRMTKMFLKSKVKPRDPYWHVRHHNLNIGREIVKANYKEQCHCHGFPGICEVMTCWFVTAPFREIAQKIKQKYDLAVMIEAKSLKATRLKKKCKENWQPSSPHDKLNRPRPHFRLANKRTTNTIPSSCNTSHHQQPHQLHHNYHLKTILPKNELIYTDDSPDYCESNPYLGFPGTRGRICNATTTPNNNCRRLCCDRGFDVELRTKKVRCRCKFKWCCEVICETCYVRRKLGVCR